MRRWFFGSLTGHSLAGGANGVATNNNGNNNAPNGGTATNKYLHIMVTTLIRNKNLITNLKTPVCI